MMRHEMNGAEMRRNEEEQKEAKRKILWSIYKILMRLCPNVEIQSKAERSRKGGGDGKKTPSQILFGFRSALLPKT
jgi:thymidylate synthase ThyX